MCMIDWSDGPCVMLHSQQRKARKEHKCGECYRVIRKGELYLNEGTLFDGQKSTVKTCSHCQVVRDWLSDECGGFLFEGVREDMIEHVRDELYPLSVWRLAAGIRRKWQTRSGRTMRVPILPPTSHQLYKRLQA